MGLPALIVNWCDIDTSNFIRYSPRKGGLPPLMMFDIFEELFGKRKRVPQSWHTRQERRVILRHGGQPLIKSGTDGILNGRPVEVRSVRKDDRYRIQKDVHQELVRDGGSYIFVDQEDRSIVVSAAEVSKEMGSGKWFKDRKYPHKFVKPRDIWKRDKG